MNPQALWTLPATGVCRAEAETFEGLATPQAHAVVSREPASSFKWPSDGAQCTPCSSTQAVSGTPVLGQTCDMQGHLPQHFEILLTTQYT